VRADSRMRIERESSNRFRVVTISDREKGASLTLVPSLKRAMISNRVNQPKEEIPNVFFLDLRSQLIEFRDRPEFRHEPLGEKDIEGRRAVGHRISRGGSVLSLWGDPKTGQPIRMEAASPALLDIRCRLRGSGALFIGGPIG
jgi:hypothetical protein